MYCFYFEKDSSIRNGIWDSDVKYWLAVRKGIINPTPAEIKKYTKMLESGQSLDDVKSFCKLTGWKYRKVPCSK